MSIRSNPVAKREWIRARRHWFWWVAVFLASLGAGFFLHLLVLLWFVRTANALTFWLGITVLGAVRVVMLATVFVVAECLERERRGNGWEELALTNLRPSEIVVGKLVVPVVFLWMTSLGISAVSLGFLVPRWGVAPWGSAAPTALWYTALLMGAGEDFLYVIMASLVVFRVGWRRPYGARVWVSLAVLFGIGLGLTVLARITFSLSYIFISLGFMQNAMNIWSIQGLTYNIPAGLGELAVAWWAYRALAEELRTGLAAAGERRVR